MPRIHFAVDTPLERDRVLAALTDFGLSRAQAWPNIDSEHFKLHDQGPGWADVTEGSAVAGGVWERERYTWDRGSGRVSVETTESNTWGPGSRWDYRLSAAPAGGTHVEVDVVRNPKGLRAQLIAAGLAVAGKSMLRRQMKQALARVKS